MKEEEVAFSVCDGQDMSLRAFIFLDDL